MSGLFLWYFSVSCCTMFIVVATSTIENNDRTEGLHRIQRELEAKLRHLETHMESQIEKLRIKVELLEIKVQQQDRHLHEHATRYRISREIEDTTSPNLVSEENQIKRNSDPKTCWEARVADRSLDSGMFWIDPDGSGRGDEPIYVYCNMTTGSTSVLHDSEGSTDVGHCFEPGCYSREIKYSGSMRQITMLSELSRECHQTIEIDCFDVALEFNNISYAWWNDRNGEPRYFWSGNNRNTSGRYHTCQCGLENSCKDKNLSCNCDSDLAMTLSDKGVITEKGLLPVTKLNFGRTISPTSSNSHQLGRLECNGKVVLDGMPTSCRDLWRIGHGLSGLYSVKATSDKVETVYCDFDKLPGDEGMETRIGFNEVKSDSVYFSVGRNLSFNSDTLFTYDYEKLNIGNGMNASSGIFTAPISGTYFFIFFSIPDNNYASLWFNLFLNDIQLEKCDPINGVHPCTILSTVQLKTGDRIHLTRTQGSTNNAVFNGWLLTEDNFRV